MTTAVATEPVRTPQREDTTVKPEWIRLPKPAHQCPHSGLSRSKLNELILGPKPPVRSVCLRKRGQVRGTRLISYDSLMAYLNSLSA